MISLGPPLELVLPLFVAAAYALHRAVDAAFDIRLGWRSYGLCWLLLSFFPVAGTAALAALLAACVIRIIVRWINRRDGYPVDRSRADEQRQPATTVCYRLGRLYRTCALRLSALIAS